MQTPSIQALLLLGLFSHPAFNFRDMQYLCRHLGFDPWQWGAAIKQQRALRSDLKKCLEPLISIAPEDVLATFPALAAHLEDLANHDVGLLCPSDDYYPPALQRLADPPMLLFYKGDAAVLSLPQIAMVGSRQASLQGQRASREFAQQFAQGGFVVTSGLARGIDAAAHQGCMNGGGKTVAVLARGLDDTYPTRHRGLARDIVDSGGVVVSEYLLGTPAMAHQFPVRNRIITGLSQALLVVEAARHSGSVVSARCAAEQGVDVFAVPGSIYSPQSEGCLDLIRDGAGLAVCPSDVVGDLQLELFQVESASPSLSSQARRVLACLSTDPVSVDQIINQLQWPAARVMASLTECEVAGVAAMVANRFVRR
ncbi:MAG: DNA-protecting protein DprA [Pseudomonadota bacterium]